MFNSDKEKQIDNKIHQKKKGPGMSLAQMEEKRLNNTYRKNQWKDSMLIES